MKNKLFLLCSSPENKFETRLFIARFERYFKQSKKNSPLLLLASFVLAAYQVYLNTPTLQLIIWQTLLVFFIVAIYKIDHQQQYSPDIERQYLLLKSRITRRLIYGLGIAVLFGASCFLLPDETPFDHLALYYIFLVCLLAIILISNITFPEYYFGYGFIIISLILTHTSTHASGHSEGFLMIASLVCPVGVLMMTLKATEMSHRAINEIALSLMLTKQMAEMLELQQTIKHQSEHDELTGLANRRKFESSASELENNAKLGNISFGVVYIDLDKFKPINDTFGHIYGDLVLQEMAQRLNACCARQSDLVCRMGGDEFCILIKNVIGQQQLQELAQSIEFRLGQTYSINGVDFNIGASIGTATYPTDGDSVDELICCADKNMYYHKQQKLALT
ncbi:MAG: GGDEF domain-containing protein [Gammaproteobacteria bacterium]|nr:GGDEF domain-containing protein [Gammaproteobacteria bacterium]